MKPIIKYVMINKCKNAGIIGERVYYNLFDFALEPEGASYYYINNESMEPEIFIYYLCSRRWNR